MQRNRAISETEVLPDLLQAVTRSLPEGWAIREEALVGGSRGRKRGVFAGGASLVAEGTPRSAVPDALITVSAPNGQSCRVAVEVKERLEPRDIPAIVGRLRQSWKAPLMVVSRYLGPTARRRLVEAGVGYADATGNLRLSLDRPALFIQTSGADADPWPVERPLKSLKGPGAGRALRALCDFRPPFGIRELAERSNTPVATIWRVVDLLDRETLVRRKERGLVESVEWAGALRRWAQDYAFTETNRVWPCLAPRGLPALLERLRKYKGTYAVTGSLAVPRGSAVAPPRLGAVYLEDGMKAAEQLDLRRTDTGANFLVAEPFDPVVFDRTAVRDGIVFAAATQVVADLLTSPGRGPAEGDALIAWMEHNERAWRVGSGAGSGSARPA